MSSNQAAIDALTVHQIFIERYSKGEAKRLLTYLERLSKELQMLLTSDYDRVRAVKLARQVAKITRAILNEYGEDMYEGLNRFAAQEALFAQQVLVATTAAEAVSAPSLRQIQSVITKVPMKLLSAKNFTKVTIDQATKQFAASKSREVAQIVRDGAVVGRTSQEIVGEISNLISTRTRAQAASLVRTATSHMSNQARMATYAANDDVVDGWDFIATLDSSTTIICASFDGRKFKLGEGPSLPLHWGERSVAAPSINPEFNLGSAITGERASMDGPVSGDVTYGGFLKRQSAEVQNEVLGVERAKLFRSGKLSIGKFTDDTGRVYTLKELTKLNNLK